MYTTQYTTQQYTLNSMVKARNTTGNNDCSSIYDKPDFCGGLMHKYSIANYVSLTR